MPRAREKRVENEYIDGPAIIRPDHAQTRELTAVAGGPRGFKRVSPLEAAYDRGQLQGGNREWTAEDRYSAGLHYDDLYSAAQASGRDSTDIDRVSKSGGGASLSQRQADAIRDLITIEDYLSSKDRKIIRMVCGDWYPASEAVRTICGDYRDTVWARLREALDSLCEARTKARKKPGYVHAL